MSGSEVEVARINRSKEIVVALITVFALGSGAVAVVIKQTNIYLMTPKEPVKTKIVEPPEPPKGETVDYRSQEYL